MQQRMVCVGLALALAAAGGPCLAQEAARNLNLAQNLAKNVTRTQPAAAAQPAPQTTPQTTTQTTTETTPQTTAPQTTAPPPAASQAAASQAASAQAAAPASAQHYSIDSKFSELLADPRATEVVITFFSKRRAAAGKPEPTAQERAHTIELIRDMTPREVSIFPQAEMDQAALVELNAELAKLPAPAPVQPSASPPTGAPASK